jgi:murein DD-endopeptidase MepM/ murein hydrolase activator NlpD
MGPSTRHRFRPQLQQLEDRLTPAWSSAPGFIFPSGAVPVSLNSQGDGVASGSIFGAFEVDYYSLQARTAGMYTIQAQTPFSNLDTHIGLYNGNGSLIAQNDDVSSGFITDSVLAVTLSAGTYYVAVAEHDNWPGFSSGPYQLSVDGPEDGAGFAPAPTQQQDQCVELPNGKDRHFPMFSVQNPVVGSKGTLTVGGNGQGNGKFGSPRSHGFHTGIDIVGVEGKSRVRPVAEGVILKVDWENRKNHNAGNGYRVIIQHKTPDGQTWYSVYAHLKAQTRRFQAQHNIRVGQVVKTDSIIGIVGKTGNANKPGWQAHLHLQMNFGTASKAIIPRIGPGPNIKGLIWKLCKPHKPSPGNGKGTHWQIYALKLNPDGTWGAEVLIITSDPKWSYAYTKGIADDYEATGQYKVTRWVRV